MDGSQVAGVDTSRLAVRERFDRWREHVRDNHGGLELVDHDPNDFHGATTVQRSRALQLVEFTSDAITYERRPSAARRDGDVTLRVLVPRAGRFRVEAADQRVVLAPGAAAMVSMAAPFSISHGRGARAWVVSIPVSRWTWPHDPRVPNVLDLRAGLGSVTAAVLRQVAVKRAALSAEEFGAAAESLADLLVRSFVASADPVHPVARSAGDVVREQSDDPGLTPASLAERMGWSLRLVQTVAQKAGTTPSAMIREARLERARARLEDPALDHLGVADVAYASGFGSISAFNAAFKTAYGSAPGDVRRR
ncbi:hypothetical protein GCM10009821_09580 [Aeromicrobium halocynthiae]|uniref:HTH araC/xylS-type domain-containing protein n=1 Tax=Aeromicrobium halocynthiae TaxID=560557 RepID=A0ABN2VUX9_9ACTN